MHNYNDQMKTQNRLRMNQSETNELFCLLMTYFSTTPLLVMPVNGLILWHQDSSHQQSGVNQREVTAQP